MAEGYQFPISFIARRAGTSSAPTIYAMPSTYIVGAELAPALRACPSYPSNIASTLQSGDENRYKRPIQQRICTQSLFSLRECCILARNFSGIFGCVLEEEYT